MRHWNNHYFNFLLLLLLCSCVSTSNQLELDPEETRVTQANLEFSSVAHRFDQTIELLQKDLNTTQESSQAVKQITRIGEMLWQDAVNDIQLNQDGDDRPLYWARLKGRILIKTLPLPFTVNRQQLLNHWEDSSRGITSARFEPSDSIKRIFISGFDPFLLDRHLNQSNPSGVAALMLDGKTIEFNGVKAQIQAVMIPVRFHDFDQGLIETSFSVYYQGQQRADLITTISMGRSEFDLERFPGKRRSAAVPGNRNVLTGANQQNPLAIELAGQPHSGPEFVEFSLPVQAMQQAKGPYKINDNHEVKTLAKGTWQPQQLSQLSHLIAVQGGGGGYLSNEISYRSVALRDKLGVKLAVGHIHTPRIKAFEPETSNTIVKQIQSMLEFSLQAL